MSDEVKEGGASAWATIRKCSDSFLRYWRKVSFLVPWLLTAVFTVLVGMVAMRHEMWRDEMQAWLLARDASSPLALLYNMRYEGHPGLWHLILWPIAHLTWNPEAMQVVHVLIAGTSAFLLLRFSPFPFLIRIVVLCGYFFAYEWAVISRNYAISVLLLFGICALFKHRWRHFPYIAGLFFLLCHTNIHSIIMTLVLVVFIMIEFAVAFAARARDAHKYLLRVAVGLIIIIAGLITGIKQTAPPEDAGFATTWYYKWTESRIRSTASTVLRAQLPVPPDRLKFWGDNRFVGKNKPDSEKEALVVPMEKWTKYGIALLLCLALPLFKRPWPGLAYISISFALLSFFYIKYPGSIRHHGFLYLSLVAAIWMSYDYEPWKISWRRPEAVLAFVDRYRVFLFLPIFAMQVWGTCVAVKYDWSAPFSVAEKAADWLKQEFPDNSAVVYIGSSGPYVTPVTGYLQAESFYYLDSGRYGSYVIWDQERRKRRHADSRKEIAELAEDESKTVVLISGSRIGRRYAGLEASQIASFTGGIVSSENYFIYLLK